MSESHITEGAELKPGDRVLVRYGRYAGQIGTVENVFPREAAGRQHEVAWVRLGDRAVEGFDPKNLVKRVDKK